MTDVTTIENVDMSMVQVRLRRSGARLLRAKPLSGRRYRLMYVGYADLSGLIA